MLKKLLIFFLIILIILVSLPVGGYFYLKAHKQEWIKLAAEKAKSQGIELNFQQESQTSPLYFGFSKISVGGATLPYRITADTLSIGPVLNAALPPISIVVRLKQPQVNKNEKYVATIPNETTSSTPLPPIAVMISGWLLPFTQWKLDVENANAPDFGVSGIQLSAALKSVHLDSSGISQAKLDHDLIIQDIKLDSPYPIPGLRSKGIIIYQPPTITTLDHTISSGPFMVQANTKYSLETKKWNSDIYIPETHFKSDTKTNGQLAWLKALNGQLYLKANVQGLGADAAAINTEGTLIAKKMKVTIDQDNVKGACLIDLNASFSKNQNLNLDAKGEFDFNDLEIKKEDLFHKPIGVPLNAKFEVVGQDRTYEIKEFGSSFNNLKATLTGKLTTGPQTVAALHAKISPTPLQGWEQFFPKFSNVKTTGLLALNADYAGPIQEWKASAIEVDLKAKDIRLPILKSWLPNNEVGVEGLINFDSDTKISYLKGVLRNLTTNTTVNLTDNQVTYSNLFHKPKGTPFEAQLAILSTSTKADIKKGNLTLGKLRSNIKGTIENFNNPTANIKVETGTLDAEELLSYSPAAKQKTITQIQGKLLGKVQITGPLTNAKVQPQLKGTTQLSKVSFHFNQEGSGKVIQLKDLTGVLSFTNDSLTAKNLKIQFPQSDLNLSLDLSNLKELKGQFNVSGNRFVASDFLEAPKKNSGGPSLIAVGSAPLAAGATMGDKAKADEDFRKNPLLQTSQIKGTINFKDFVLFDNKAQQFSANISYDKLLLHLDPVSFKAYNGAITSRTVWNGREKIPTTEQKLKVDGVDANQFLTSSSESAKDLVTGRFSSEMQLELKGMSTEEIKKSLKGEGNFSLVDGKLKTIRFTQKPLETLKKVPLLSKAITKTDWDEKINDATGKFKISDGKLYLSNLLLHSPYFDASTDETTLDLDQNINSKFVVTLKDTVVEKNTLEALKDSSGRPAIPLTLTGPIQNPSVGIDDHVVEARVKAFAAKKAEEEAKRAVTQVKNKAQEELEKKLKQGLGGFFK